MRIGVEAVPKKFTQFPQKSTSLKVWVVSQLFQGADGEAAKHVRVEHVERIQALLQGLQLGADLTFRRVRGRDGERLRVFLTGGARNFERNAPDGSAVERLKHV